MIKHKPGDILEPSGCIFIEVGKVQQSGIVIIHRSRLKRAKRFGWLEAPAHIVHPAEVAPELVAVCRA